jgi:hypothetical protein
MRKLVRTAIAVAVLAGWAFADDVRYSRPDSYWIPGWMEGDYLGESGIAVLPDVIDATLQNLTPRRTLEKI